MMAKMRSASRRALTELSDRFNDIAKDLDNKALDNSAERAGFGGQMLDREIVVTRYLTVPAEDGAPGSG